MSTVERFLNETKYREYAQELSRPDKANERGTQLYKSGKFDEAAQAYSHAGAVNSRIWSGAGVAERATILSNRAAAYLSSRGGRLEEAEADARASLELRPGNAKGLWRHAKTLYALGRFAEAAVACSSAAAADSSAPASASYSAYSRGREVALRAAEAAAAARKLCEEGSALFSPEAPEEAREGAAALYRRALELNPADMAAGADLAAALLSLRRLAECADLALAAACRPSLVASESRPAAAKLFVRAGLALGALGRPIDAAASLRLALDFAPGLREAASRLREAEAKMQGSWAGGPAGDGRWEGGGAGLDACAARVAQPAAGGARLSNYVAFENHYLQYPFGNTEARPAASREELLQASGSGRGRRPVAVLFVGVGDVRNVLRTAQEAAGPGAPRLAFSLVDVDRCVLARDVLLLAAVSEMREPAPEDLRFLWRAWFCLEMPPGERRRLNTALAALADAAASPAAWRASPFGAWLRVPCDGDLALLREVWEYWLSPAVPPLAHVRVQRHSHSLRISQLHDSGWKPAELRTQDRKIGAREQECQRRVQLLAPAFADVEREMADWYRTWSAAPDDATRGGGGPGSGRPGAGAALNPTLVAPPRGLCLTHYSLHPFGAFAPEDLAAFADAAAPPRALALVPGPASGEADGIEEPPPRELCRATLRLLAQMVVPFAEALCWEGAGGGGPGALPAGERFDFIDCSNLADNEGLWPLLLACGWRLREADHAALMTTSMKWNSAHADPRYREYLREELGFAPELAPTLLGLCLATDVDAMQQFMRPPPTLSTAQSNSAYEIVLAWKRPRLRGPPTGVRVAEGDPLHRALAELADRAAHHADLLGGGKKHAKQPSHSTLYLFAATVADLARRAANPAELLRMADALVAARAVGGSLALGSPLRPCLAAQWRVARALAGLDGTTTEEALVYIQLAPSPTPLPPTLATGLSPAALLGPGGLLGTSPPCPMVRLLVAAGAGPGGTHAAFDLLDFDHWTGTVGLFVPAALHAAAARADAEVLFAAAETGAPCAAPVRPLRYSAFGALPGGPPVPRSALAGRPLPEPAPVERGVDLCETEAAYRATVDFGGSAQGPVTARIEHRHSALFSSQDGQGLAAACLHPLEGEPELEPSCGTCGRSDGTLSACTQCQAVLYCGRDCQRADWRAGHRERCGRARAPAAARATFTLSKGAACDIARVNVCALPKWADVEEIGKHMQQMHSMSGYMRRMAEVGEVGASTGDPLRDLKESLTILFVMFIRVRPAPPRAPRPPPPRRDLERRARGGQCRMGGFPPDWAPRSTARGRLPVLEQL
eukprot:tig00001258_g7828.t1